MGWSRLGKANAQKAECKQNDSLRSHLESDDQSRQTGLALMQNDVLTSLTRTQNFRCGGRNFRPAARSFLPRSENVLDGSKTEPLVLVSLAEVIQFVHFLSLERASHSRVSRVACCRSLGGGRCSPAVLLGCQSLSGWPKRPLLQR